jgi:hypothetical protein
MKPNIRVGQYDLTIINVWTTPLPNPSPRGRGKSIEYNRITAFSPGKRKLAYETEIV